MAIIHVSALLNRIYGLLGSVIYQTYKGTDYVRISPGTWTNPNTSRQQQVRANLAQMSAAWDSIPPSHQELWDSFASLKGCRYFGRQAYISHNCNLLNASHADLTCISSPPTSPGTSKHVQGFCVASVTPSSVLLLWSVPSSTILYVSGQYRLHRGFCAANPCYGLCPTTGYRPSFRFIRTVRSDLTEMLFSHDYSINTRLFFKLNSLDKFGRKSPISHTLLTRPVSGRFIYDVSHWDLAYYN